MKHCKIENCLDKYYAKEYCRSHYRILHNNEASKRWVKLKRNPLLYANFAKSRKKYIDKVKGEDWFKEKHNKLQYKYYHKDDKRKEYLKKWKDDFYFGSLRAVVIKRDSFKCTICGISREEHYAKYKMDLSVHHINKKGRMVEKNLKDNRLENLQTLCASCHMKEDRKLARMR